MASFSSLGSAHQVLQNTAGSLVVHASQHLSMSSRGGRGRGAFYKEKYGGGGRGRGSRDNDNIGQDSTRQQRWTDGSKDFTNGGGGGGRQHSHHAQGAASGSHRDLQDVLRRIHNSGYKAYHDIRGSWTFPEFTLHVDHIQGDPYAAPSRCRVVVPSSIASFPPTLWSNRPRTIALCDFLTRSFGAAVKASGGDIRAQSGSWGGMKGGELEVDSPGQFVLERSSVIIHNDGSVEARFTVGLPARGRSVMGDVAATVLIGNVPRYVTAGLQYGTQDARALSQHVDCVEDTEYLRSVLSQMGLVAFVGNGAILPRASGASDKPMTSSEAVPFTSPPSLQVEVTVPHRGTIRGMGIRRGITLIVGGGFHGKSTLLEALQTGIYNTIPGDGRELVATDPTAVKIRAEDGRRVASVDITPFINNLPLGRDTKAFSSTDASGSTSQAAAIQEALEIGSQTLLIDEDTSATNFMVRDTRMRELVAADREPITPFVCRVRALAQSGISSILVIGGTGEYFDSADCVIAMDSYKAEDVTERAHAIAAKYAATEDTNAVKGKASATAAELQLGYPQVVARTLVYGASQGSRGSDSDRHHDVRCKTRSTHVVQVDDEDLDLSGVEQLVEKSQTRAIAASLGWMRRQVTGALRGAPLNEILKLLEAEIDRYGLDALSGGGGDFKPGNMARPRRYEVAAAVNRLRSQEVEQVEERR